MQQHVDNTSINLILVVLLVAILSAAALTRLQPHMMRALADYLNARADSEDWFKRRHREYRQDREEKDKVLESTEPVRE